MDNTIQINRERARDEALATALGRVMLKFLTVQVNILLATSAVICLLLWLITDQHTTVAIFATGAWAGHLAIMLTISIVKGGDQL